MKNKQIIIHKKLTEKNTKNYFPAVNLDISRHGFAYINASYLDKKLNPVKQERTLIDWGLNSLFTMPYKSFNYLKEKHLLNKVSKGFGSTFSGSYGKADQMDLYITELNIGINNITFNPIVVHIDSKPPRDYALVGCEFLKFNKTIIDYKKKKAYFKPYPNTQKKNHYNTMGFSLEKEGNKVIVNYIWYDSDAGKKGLKFGDQILKINGVNLQDHEITDEMIEEINYLLDIVDNITLEVNTKGNFIEIELSDLLE